METGLPDKVGNSEDHSRSLAHWLQESARRRWPHPLVPAATPVEPTTGDDEAFRRHVLLALFALTSLAFLGYLYVDVQIQVLSMQRLIFFR